MLKLGNLSIKNLTRIQRLLEIILDYFDLKGISSLTSNRIPFKMFKKEGFIYEDMETIIGKINEEKNIIEIKDNLEPKPIGSDVVVPGAVTTLCDTEISKEDLEEHIFLEIKDINSLKEIKEELEKPEYNQPKKLNFNYLDSSLSLDNEFYKPRDELRKKFIKELWVKHQKQTNSGKVKESGERMRESHFAVLMGMIGSENEFTNQSIKNRFKRIKKELKRIFDDKKFLLKIDSGPEGILLIETLK